MHRVVTHIKEMLNERGYNVEQNEQDELTFEKQVKQGEKECTKVYIARYIVKNKLGVHGFDSDSKKINISAKETKKINEEILKYIVINTQTQPRTKVIVVFPQELIDKYNPEKILEGNGTTDFYNKTDKIVVFSEKDFKFNPTKNALVPKHELASKKDEMLLEAKKIKKSDLPKILKNEPICKWYGFQPGEIIKIRRDYEKKTYYRCVSDE